MAETPDDTDKLGLEVARPMRRISELQTRPVGYEIAITAVLGVLDASGALPLRSTEAAIDEAAAVLAHEPHASDAPISVLRQLSARLQPSDAAGPTGGTSH